jgi:deazaflavin-dependent oxidoreductase (nitroreductase family)
MNPLTRAFNAIGGSLMARSGRVGILGTTGAKTGLPRTAPIGFVARPDGTLLIGSGSSINRGWTANLKANPAATFSVKGVQRRYRARLVAAGERQAALDELRATMGRMAERTDWGDLFVLEPEETP